MRARVFVFDDEPMIRRVFSTVARRCGCDVEVFRGAAPCVPSGGLCPCGSGEACMDAILTDHNMPGMTGLDFAAHLRACGCGCRHIAMISGYLTPEVTEKARSLQVDLFSKPMAQADLVLWLERCCRSIPPGRSLVDHYGKGPAAKLHEASLSAME